MENEKESPVAEANGSGEMANEEAQNAEEQLQQRSPISDKIIEELTEENLSDPNWSGNGKSQEQLNASPPRPDEERILSLTVDIPQGTQEVLEIRASDDIEGITERFCAKHELDAECKQMLLDNIRAHLFGTTGTEQQIQEDQQEEDRVDTEVAGQPESSGQPESPLQSQPAEAETEEPKRVEELAGELESWKKEVEQQVKEKMTLHNHPVINENSKRIVERHGFTRVPVYERLHNKALVKQRVAKKEKEKEKLLSVKVDLAEKSRRPATASNPLEEKKPKKESNIYHHYLLYQRGMKQMQTKQRMAEEAKQRQVEKDHEVASFKPHINSSSRMMVNRDVEHHEDYLLSYGKLVEEKLSEKRAEKDAEERKGSFRPNISTMSQKIVAGKTKERSGSTHQLLYEDAVRRKEQKKESQPSGFTFTPALTKLDPNMFKGVEKPTPKKPDPTEREKNECTFKPKINGSSGAGHRKEGSQPVGDYLLKMQKDHEDKLKKRVEEEDKKAKEMSKTKFVQDKSAKMLEKYENEKLQEIFKALDSDKDGTISAAKVDISQLSLKLLEIFTPLLGTMEKEGLTLTQDEFMKMAYKSYKTLTTYDKKAIFDFKRRFKVKEELEQPTFTPKFDPLSLKLSEKRRPPGENIVDIFSRERHENEKKLEAKKKELEMKETGGCTFSPSILRTKNGKDSTVHGSQSVANILADPNSADRGECTFTVASGALKS